MIGPGVVPEEAVTVLGSGIFDEIWYRAHYTDLAAADVDALTHFLTQGWREGRSPGPEFELSWYAKTYAGVVPEDTNPALFYLTEGWRLGHLPSPHFDPTAHQRKHSELVEVAFSPLEFALAVRAFS